MRGARPPLVAVLTAAGSGSRLGMDVPKALVELGGVPLVGRAAAALAATGELERLVVTAPAAALDQVTTAVRDATRTHAVQVAVVEGGASRQA
ncbi:2-C-methyl-D-erythritol 4-phosphate cytidylyltransferase, partial [Cellulomonas bogoriensis]|uniref:2-C-methyl-D-erythritol 4-phosphate cytidylyltransferase n=1 Tax=Cellulomonas bogoriensis TaxID=301388 RepID=UPI001E60DFC2